MSIRYETDTPAVRAFVARLLAQGKITDAGSIHIAGVDPRTGKPVLVTYGPDGIEDEWRDKK